MLIEVEREGLAMENCFANSVQKRDRYLLILNGKNQRSAFDNIRFVLNANNYRMQMLARRTGFTDFKEMVETYYKVSDLSFQDVEGDLELLCNIVL